MKNRVDILLTWPSDGVRLLESMAPLGLANLAAVLREDGSLSRSSISIIMKRTSGLSCVDFDPA